MASRYGQITMSKSIMQDLSPSRASLFLVLAVLICLRAYPVQAQNVIANKRDVPEVVRRPILPNETFYDSLISAYHNNPQLQAQRARSLTNWFTVIYDATGKEILTAKNKSKIDISNLPDGVYWIEIRDENNHRVGVETVVKME